MEKKLKSTRNRKAIRIELPKYASEKKAAWLIEKLYVTNDMVYEIDGPLNLASFFEFIGKAYKPELSDKKILRSIKLQVKSLCKKFPVDLS